MAKAITHQELHRKFRQVLENKHEDIRRYAREDRAEKARAEAYKIDGMAYFMYRLGLISYEEKEHIKKTAMAAAERRELEYEAC